MYGYKVDLRQTNLSSNYSDEQFGDWSRESSWELKGISKTKDHPDIVSSLDVKPGEQVFVVWVQWGSGDSFGFHHGAEAEGLAIFRDEAAARDFSGKVRRLKDEGRNSCSFKIKIQATDGQLVEVYAGWLGYFERLEAVNVKKCVMGNNNEWP